MTPEQARKIVASAEKYADDDKRAVLAEIIDAGELVDALLTVASMYFMYAVQIEDVTGKTKFATSAHGATSDIRDAWWTSAPNTALADHWRENTNANDVRIVRRLMADPEVAP